MTDLSRYYDESYPPSVWGGGPDPFISSLVPNTGSAAAGAILITVNGTNFEAGSQVEIAQQDQPTTFISEAQLQVTWDPPAPITVNFTVRNPSDEESNSVPFTVTAITAADVDGWTIDEVKAFIVEHPDLLAEVFDLETNGQARVTLLTWLQTLLDEENETEDEDDEEDTTEEE